MLATMPKSMMKYFMLALPLVAAIPWEGPVPTRAVAADSDLAALGWSPAPTAEPALLFGIYELRRRQTASSSSSFSHATCGFLRGDSGNPLTCVNSGFTCAVASAQSVFGCCSNLASCSIRTSCVPQASLSACDSNCVGNVFVAKCNPTSPYCNQNLLVRTGSPTFTNWFCDDSPTIVTQFAVATDGGSPTAALATVTLNVPTSSSTISTSAESTSPTSSPSGVSPSTITVTPTATPPPASTSKKTPVGGIVGGVVGGIAVIVAIIGALWFRRRNKNKTQAPVEAAGTATGAPPAPGAGLGVPVEYYGQPSIAEKEAAVPINNNQGPQGPQGPSEMYSPPQSPAPKYSPETNPSQPVSPAPGHQIVYPNMHEMDGGAISHRAAPGTY